ncbi:MAG: SPASM domain-containing protein [Deltaproteobacteria bacterium]|nr:SPASM domain-containing protein [Deltaproteobacteria bacterium]
MDVFKKLIDETQPKRVNVSGLGEPFINKNIFDMIAYARNAGAKINCATNLTLVERKIEDIVKSGINQLKVSIDAAKRETYNRIRKKDLYETLIVNIKDINETKKRLNSTTPTIRLNYALQYDNIDELLDTIKLARSLGIKSMYIQYLEYTDREKRRERLTGDLTAERVRKTLEAADALAKRYGIATNLPIWFRDFDLYWNKMLPIEQFKPNRKPCYFPWFTAWIDADGTVRPCPIIPWKLGVAHMGNINSTPFMEIWNNKKYQELRRTLANGDRPTEPCKYCIPMSLFNIFHIGTRLIPGKI